MILSEHFKRERADRYVFIVTTIGLGKVIHSYKQRYNKWGTEPCVVDITDTGVAIVRTKDNIIVTMYVLTITEAKTYFDGVVPMVLEAIIRTNMKRRYCTLQNERQKYLFFVCASPRARARGS